MRREAGLNRHGEVPKGALAGLRVEGRGLPVTGKRQSEVGWYMLDQRD